MTEGQTMLDLYNAVSGREFKSEHEAMEHLENLQKLAFKKKDEIGAEVKAQADSEWQKKLEAELSAKEENVKKELEPYKRWMEQAKIDMSKVNPLAVAEYLGEQHEDIKPRTEAVDEHAAVASLEERIAKGTATQEERNSYVRKTILGPKK